MKISQLFPSKYIKAADLNGKSFTLTIKLIKIEKVGHGPEEETLPVLYFKEATKGLVLKRTNALAIADLYGDETDNWAGKRITLYPTQVRAFGKLQDTIRVRDCVPAQPKPAQDGQAEERSTIDDDEDIADKPTEAVAAA